MGIPRCAPRRSKLALFGVAVAAGLALLGGTAALAWLLWLALPGAPEPEVPGAPSSGSRSSLPQTWAADSVRLADDAEVIGVSVNGKWRAYRLGALANGPHSHIVNDLVGGRPLSVVYCDIHDCVQVVAGAGDRPLDLEMGGLDPKGLLLAVGRHRYREDTLEPLEESSPAFPYQRHAWERTTWGAWKKAHPDTDIFLSWGTGSPPQPQSERPRPQSHGQAGRAPSQGSVFVRGPSARLG
jgi:hypothetical protein